MSKRIFITGGAGFIGSNLAISLVEKGYNVVVYDNLSQGYLENLTPIRECKNFSFIQGDIMSFPDLLNASKDADAIVHLAAFKIPRYTDAYDTLIINGMGSHNVAQAAVHNDCHLIAASTSDVYGKNNDLPFSEDSDSVIGSPRVKRWAYAISKMYEEQLLLAYQDRYKIPVTLVRFFGGYGPHQHLTWWGGPQAVFINQALDGKPLEIHGDGLQTRTFTYIADHVQGLTLMLEHETSKDQIFNLGSFEEITILDLARKISCLIHPNQEPQIQLISYETFGKYEDVRRRVPNIQRAQELLGYFPQYSLNDGLQKTIEWQKIRRGGMVDNV